MSCARIILILMLFSTSNAWHCSRSEPLGLISEDIRSWQISASSSYPNRWDRYCSTNYARVYETGTKAWCAKRKSPSEWIQVDLGVAASISGVMTQGRCDGREWVTSFKISYSHDAFHWKYINDAYGNERTFEGNVDSCSVRHSYIDKPIVGRFLRFHTISWKGHPSMRVEILGCQPCKQPLALPPYAKTTASSESSPNKRNSPSISGTAQDSYLLTKGAWCAQKSDKQPWLQIDVGPPTILTAVSTKGLGEFRKKRWVTSFNISYANSTTGPWYNYSESGNDFSFSANSDKYSEKRHYFGSPIKARFIRFYPTKWRGKQPCMRAGVFGCPQNGICQKGYLRVSEDSPCVENVVYGRKSFVNNKRHFKRHVGEWSGSNQAQRAVDGEENQSIHHCTILDNFYVSRPFWMVDLGQGTPISGVVIVTWQGKNLKTNSAVKSSYYDYMRNLRKLTVYVSSKKKKVPTATLR